MRTYYVAPLPPLHVLDGAAFNTFTTFQSITPAPGIVIPANLLEIGSELRLTAAGEFSNTGTPTLGIGFFYGAAATPLAAGAALTTITGAASWPWTAEWRGRVRAVGTAGSIQGAGEWRLGISLTAFSVDQAMPATLALRTVAINTTTANEIGVGAVWGTSNAANTIKVTRFSAELVS
jgi:hypothetical protein